MKKIYFLLSCLLVFAQAHSQLFLDPLSDLEVLNPGEKERVLSFQIDHGFKLVPDLPLIPQVATVSFNHVWTKTNGVLCSDPNVYPPQTNNSSFVNDARDIIEKDLVFNSGSEVELDPLPGDVNTPFHLSKTSDNCGSMSEATSDISLENIDQFNVTGQLQTLGFSQGIINPDKDVEAYAFCMGGVSLIEGRDLMKGQIDWDPKIISHLLGKVKGIRQKGGTNDPIVFEVRDSTGLLLDSGTLFTVKMIFDSGEDTVDLVNYWDNDTVHIESPNAEFYIEFPSDFTSVKGFAHLKIENSIVTVSSKSGVFTGITLPAINDSVPLSFKLDDSLSFHYNLDTVIPHYTNDSLRVKIFMYGNSDNNYVHAYDTVIFATPVINAASCFGGNNATISISVAEGIAPFAYVWSNGATTQSVTGLTAGVITVTVTDALGVSAAATYIVSQPLPIAVAVASQINPTSALPASGAITITVSGGTAPYAYTWSNGSFSQNLAGLIAATYTVTVTDANGCTSSKSVTLSIVCGLSYTTQVVQNASCYFNNGIVTVLPSGGTSYSYAWQTIPVQTNATATGLAYGINSYVTITDASGCVLNVTVPVPTSLGLGLNITSPVFAGGKNISCNGGNNGSINLSVSGSTAPYSYTWSNGATTQNLAGLNAATYTVTVTNGGCTATGFITLNQAAAMQVAVAKSDPSCFGASTGSATAAGSGGVAPYSYSWNTIPVKTNAVATGLAAGAYTVTVTDANGCTKTASVALSSPAVIVVAGVVANSSCFGGSTGSIDITPSGGVPAYTYLWNTGATTQDRINVLAAGTYTVTVTDSKGCTKQYSNNVGQPTAIAATATTTNVTCYGASTGAATVAASGGTPPYTYSWNTTPAKTTAAVTGLKKGTYTALITDSKGCVKAVNITITEPVSISISISKTNVAVHGGSNGTATANVSGGIAPYSYLWNTVPVQFAQTATGLIAGTYTVTVTDANGCTKTGSVTITQPARFAANTAPDGTPYSTVYPNPSNGFTTVWFSEFIKDHVQFIILNLHGQKVFESVLKLSASTSSFQIDVSTLPKGIYIMKYRTNDREWVDKLVIQ